MIVGYQSFMTLHAAEEYYITVLILFIIPSSIIITYYTQSINAEL